MKEKQYCASSYGIMRNGIVANASAGGLIADGRYTNTAMRCYCLPGGALKFLRPRYGALGTNYGHSLPLFMRGCREAISALQLRDGYIHEQRFCREKSLYYARPKADQRHIPNACRRSMRKAIRQGTVRSAALWLHWLERQPFYY